MDNIFKATSLQQQIFSFQRINPENAAYNLNYCFKIEGKINIHKFEESVHKTVNSHRSLTSNFVIHGDSLFRQENNSVLKVEVQNFLESEEENVFEQITLEANTSTDMESFPLTRVKIYWSPQTTFFYMKVHHSIFDALSLDVILDEIKNEYLRGGVTEEDIYLDNTLEINQSDNIKGEAIQYEKYLFNGEKGFATKNLEFGNTKVIENTSSIAMNKVEKMARFYGVSTFCIILGVYCYILSQITYSEDVSLGVPFGNRSEKMEKAVGLFVNTLPLKITIKSGESFFEYIFNLDNILSRLKKYQSVDIIGNQNQIFEQNSEFSPINSTITYYNHYQSFSFPDLIVTRIDIKNNNLMFPISIKFEKYHEQLLLHTSVMSLFSEIDFAEIYSQILSQIEDIPDILIGNMRLLSEQQEHKISEEINSKGRDYQFDEKTIIDLFKEAVAANGNKVAVSYENVNITYRELDIISNRLANTLLKRLSNKYVVVSIPLSDKLIPLLLAILKVSKIYVPIDENMPEDRKNLIFDSLEDFNIIGNEKITGENNKFAFTLEELIKQSENVPEEKTVYCNPSDIAYVLFTSGSTGIPKGIKVTHKNIRSLFLATNQEFDFSSNDVWTMFHSYSFDFSLWEIFGPLTTGGKLVIVPSKVKIYPDAFWNILKQNRATIVSQTPSAFANLLRYEASQNTHVLKDIRYLFLGGEYISYNSIEPWKKFYKDSNMKFVGVYGVTEAAVLSFCREIDDKYRDVDVLGKPLPNTHAFVRTITGQVAPRGFMGEIVLSGDAVGTGYYNNEEKGKRVFKRENILFRENTFFTNDLAILDKNFELIYVSRADRQVKISGHRIELGEIENVINSYPNCEASIVIPHAFSKNDIRLIGYYIPSEGKVIDKDDFKKFLQTKLQRYMIPQSLLEIEEKPLTINGKLDTSLLMVPDITIPSNNGHTKTSIDRVIEIWGKVVNQETITSDDKFFEVGGSSLLITDVYYRILEEFHLTGKEVSMVDLFEYSTPKEIADFLDGLI